MADTYTDHARLRKIESGGQTDLYGTENNNTFELVEEMLWHVETIVITTDYNLAAIPDDATGETRHAFLHLTGTPGAAFNLVLPASLERVLVVKNSTGDACTVKYAASTGVVVADGNTEWILADGSEAYLATVGEIADATTLAGTTQYVRKDQQNTHTAGKGMGLLDLGNVSGSVQLNPLNRLNYKMVLTGAATLVNPISLPSSTYNASMHAIIKQDPTGGRTLAFGANWNFAGGSAPVASTGANAIDVMRFTQRGTQAYVESYDKAFA